MDNGFKLGDRHMSLIYNDWYSQYYKFNFFVTDNVDYNKLKCGQTSRPVAKNKIDTLLLRG